MLFNYHTHTPRCNHATGDEREYVECAIAGGFKTLGFSDHAPYVFPDKTFRSGHRMSVDQLQSYAEKIRALAKEYEKDIRILCGFELEYYPDFHDEEMAFLRTARPDYILLGQHYLGNEYNGLHIHHGSDDLLLIAYVTQVISALNTGDFLYLAHPDMPGGNFSPQTFAREYRRLCEFAKKKNVPLEINLLGLSTNRCYPDREFFKIAAEVGNEVILGVDAHAPEMLLDKQTQARALEMVQDLGLKLIETPLL